MNNKSQTLAVLTDCDALLTMISIAANDICQYAREVELLKSANCLRKMGDVLVITDSVRELIYEQLPHLRPQFDQADLNGEKAALRSIVERESHESNENCVAHYRSLMPLKSEALQKFVEARLTILESP